LEINQGYTTMHGQPIIKTKFDVHESVRRDTTMKITNKMQYID